MLLHTRNAWEFQRATIKTTFDQISELARCNRTYVRWERAILGQDTVILRSQGAISAGVGDRPIDMVRGKIGAYSLAHLPVLDILSDCSNFSSTVGGRDHVGKRASRQGD